MFQTQIPMDSKSTAITESFLQPKELHMLRWILECQRIKPYGVLQHWVGTSDFTAVKLSKVELEAEQLLKQTLEGGSCLPRGVDRGCDMVENNVIVLLQVHIGYEEFV